MKYAGTMFMLFVLFSCEQPTEPISPTVDSITISPSEAGLFVGDTLQFNAVVEGTGELDSTVTWYVNGTAGGNTEYGTIAPEGLYTAPLTVPAETQVTIRAVSITDPTKWGLAMVSIYAVESVTVSPQYVTVEITQTVQFTASIVGTGSFDTSVLWYINDVGGGSDTYGTITTNGLYTAPEIVPTNGVNDARVIVKAKSVVDSFVSDSAIVDLYVIDSVAITPQSVDSLYVHQEQRFSMLIYGEGNPPGFVSYSVNGIESGSERYGYIDGIGLYKAPPTIPYRPIPFTGEAESEEVTVRVALVADSSKHAATSFVIISGFINLGIIPTITTVMLGDSIQFSPVFYGVPVDSTVEWFVTNAWGTDGGLGGNERVGTVSETGFYIAPDSIPSTCLIFVSVQSIADRIHSASAFVYFCN